MPVSEELDNFIESVMLLSVGDEAVGTRFLLVPDTANGPSYTPTRVEVERRHYRWYTLRVTTIERGEANEVEGEFPKSWIAYIVRGIFRGAIS